MVTDSIVMPQRSKDLLRRGLGEEVLTAAPGAGALLAGLGAKMTGLVV